MKSKILYLIILGGLIVGCGKTDYQIERDYWMNVRYIADTLKIGDAFPDSLKKNLMEATPEYEKWQLYYCFTLKHGRIVSKWSHE